MRRITILGATGTIGANTLDVVSRHRDRFEVFALTANTQTERMYQLCLAHRPRYAVMSDEVAAEKLQSQLRKAAPDIVVLSGVAGLAEVAAHPQTDMVMAAIVGAAGLVPTLAAARAGKRILLANKEALVMSGQLFMDEIAQNNAELLPIDSEHNAIFQCLPPKHASLHAAGVSRILLTGSGGPFRTLPLEQLHTVTPQQAIAHPNWNMGKKISVDSATMMNKGLEIIEACWLFQTPPEKIEVVLHPQSIIHSMVEYRDGSILAQMGQPDMRTPIANALAWPERIDSGVTPLDLFQIAKLEFTRPDYQRYPCLMLAQNAFKTGGTATTILNAANEIAVAAFLDGKIQFTQISQIVETVLNKLDSRSVQTLDDVITADQEARWMAMECLAQNQRKVWIQ